MQMSSIETNLQLVNSMEKLTTSYAQSALSNAANVIGKNVEDGNINEQGINKAYTVRSVVNQDGQVMVKAQEILFLEQQIKITDEEGESTLVNYNTAGQILDDKGEVTGMKVTLSAPGQVVLDKDGKPIILDEDNEPIEDHKYEMAGGSMPVYSDQLTELPFSAITKIF
jgi:flagellar basal-body rod modification protein FlgD